MSLISIGPQGATLYFGFVCIGCIGRLLILPRWNVYPLKIIRSFPDSSTLIRYTSVGERGIVRIKCLVQELNTMTQPGVEPTPLYPKSNAFTVSPLRLWFNLEGLFLTILVTPAYFSLANFGSILRVNYVFFLLWQVNFLKMLWGKWCLFWATYLEELMFILRSC